MYTKKAHSNYIYTPSYVYIDIQYIYIKKCNWKHFIYKDYAEKYSGPFSYLIYINKIHICIYNMCFKLDKSCLFIFVIYSVKLFLRGMLLNNNKQILCNIYNI